MSKRTSWNSTLPAPTKPLTRKTRLRPINPERKKRRKEADEVYGSYYVHVANMRTCVLTRGSQEHVCVHFDSRRPEAHHMKRVGSGGKDAENLLDTCHAAHDEFHCTPLPEMEDIHDLDFDLEAARLWADYCDETET